MGGIDAAALSDVQELTTAAVGTSFHRPQVADVLAANAAFAVVLLGQRSVQRADVHGLLPLAGLLRTAPHGARLDGLVSDRCQEERDESKAPMMPMIFAGGRGSGGLPLVFSVFFSVFSLFILLLLLLLLLSSANDGHVFDRSGAEPIFKDAPDRVRVERGRDTGDEDLSCIPVVVSVVVVVVVVVVGAGGATATVAAVRRVVHVRAVFTAAGHVLLYVRAFLSF